MHPYAIDRMVEERRQELLRLGRADIGARAARRARRRSTTRLRVPFASLAARLARRPVRRRVLDPCPEAPVRPC